MYLGKDVSGVKFSVGGILGPGPGAFLNMMNAARGTVPADTLPTLCSPIWLFVSVRNEKYYLIVVSICISIGLYTDWFIRALYILRKLDHLSFVP